MLTLIFVSDPRSGQVEVKRSNFETQNILLKHASLVQFRFRIPKMSFLFTYDDKKCQKTTFQKVTS